MKTLYQRWRNVFSLDTNSLAIFRIVFGCVLLLWLTDWIWQLDWLLGSQAIVTPAMSFKYFMRDTTWNFHLIHGEKYWYYALFFIHYCLVLAFIMGRNTRTVTFFLWIFTVSLWSSNIPAYNHFDTLLGIMLFWSIFLPVSYNYSRDSYKKFGIWKGENKALCSLATVGVTLQIFIIYVYAAYARWDATRIKDMTGLRYVLHNTILTFPLGTLLAKHMSLTKILSIGYMMLEGRGWLGFLVPWKQLQRRKITILCFMALHIGIMLTMDIEVISLEMIAIWLMFWPRERDAGYLKSKEGITMNMLQVGVIVFVTLWIFTFLRPDYKFLLHNNYHRYGKILGITQTRGAFLGKHNVFIRYVIEGKTNSGSISILPERQQFSLENMGTHHFSGEKQRKFFENISHYTWLSEPILEYYCNKNKDRVDSLVLHKVRQHVEPETGYGALESLVIANKNCQ